MPMIMFVMRVITPTRSMDLRGEDTSSFIYGGLRADGTHVIGAAVQAFHLTEAGESRCQVIGRGPFDANFFAAAGAFGGGRE